MTDAVLPPPGGAARRAPGRWEPRRAIETTLLVLVAILLVLATAHDVSRQIKVNHRLTADLVTWRALTGHDYHNLRLEQDVKGFSTREVVCGNVSPGPPGARPQMCLVIRGPVVGGRRSSHGGYRLPAYVPDLRRHRYGCFGSALSEHLCEPAR
jgi:hypothetical protein